MDEFVSSVRVSPRCIEMIHRQRILVGLELRSVQMTERKKEWKVFDKEVPTVFRGSRNMGEIPGQPERQVSHNRDTVSAGCELDCKKCIGDEDISR